MTHDDPIDLARLAARLHDPPEKALVLMRTEHGHEGGSVRTLSTKLFSHGLPGPVRQAVKQADHWASAADRAAFPNHEDDGRYPGWQQVRFSQRPVIIHPLTGARLDLGKLEDVHPEQAEALSVMHFEGLIQRDAEGSVCARRTADAFWRFGPAIDASEIASLWPLLPADTRVPDHTIFDHLDLTAALASSFAADGQGGPALLAVSIGPVQDFIAAARSTSDLWAGSHLLARLSWEAMRVVCEACGPEAVLFPRLRGVPQVDLWLRDSRGLAPELFASQPWASDRTDGNPLFAAALPNRFTAIVPAGAAAGIGERITTAVRACALGMAQAAWAHLLDASGETDAAGAHGRAQIEAQLAGFPEVHWAVVPWSLAATDAGGKVDPDDTGLAEAMQPFFGSTPPGYLGTGAWKLLSRGLRVEEGWFWKPNPGTLYPALHELLERALAAAKSAHTFTQLPQQGWRCALTGESEWITTDPAQLTTSYRQRKDTVWARAAGRFGIKAGEHLGALAMLKRLWPKLVVDELRDALGIDLQRFVVSTHTMALTGTLLPWIERNTPLPAAVREALDSSGAERVALPRRLRRALQRHPDADHLARIPDWLDQAAERDEDATLGRRRSLLSNALDIGLENYYGLLLLDGDEMGAWLAAAPEKTLPCRQSFHPQLDAALDNRFVGDPNFRAYAAELRGASPSRHMAISEALNHFSLTLAPALVAQYGGRLVYAGGDDVLALLPASELLAAAVALRCAYSGLPLDAVGLDGAALRKEQANGFVRHQGRLMRMMGEQATASCGLVIAHHQAPLSGVLRELHAAERRAKDEGGRNAWSLALVKRAGGTVNLTAKWGAPLQAFERLRHFVADEGVSRRAVYNSLDWLVDLPADDPGLLAALLVRQFKRQARSDAIERHDVPALVRSLVEVAFDAALRPASAGPLEWLHRAMLCAEFLARDERRAAPRRSVAERAGQ